MGAKGLISENLLLRFLIKVTCMSILSFFFFNLVFLNQILYSFNILESPGISYHRSI